MEERIVVIGASAGGVEALSQVIGALPSDFPAAICIVLHIPAESPSLLSMILDRRSALHVKDGEDGDALRPGTAYVAPPDHHLVVGRDGTLRATRGPRENRHRPALDPLFRSAARAYGSRAIGVVLTGNLDDGTAGLMAIKQQGGFTIVQDPADAMFPDMPRNALEHTNPNVVAPLDQIAAAIMTAVHEKPKIPGLQPADTRRLDIETLMAEMDHDAMHEDDRPGVPSPWSCPDCGGVMWQIDEDQYSRFRCRVGHAYSPESILGAQADQFEEAMWTAMKTLEESARLAQRLSRSEGLRGHEWMARRFADREREARERVEIIRQVLARGMTLPPSHADVQEEVSGD
ncbi:MAG TPA: chemotaxis protein CheB [Thermoanaerobaculia bacterium]